MPLIYEARQEPGDMWRQVGPSITADQQPGSITHIAQDGQREMIVFACNGSTSVVAISRGGTDQEIGLMRRIDSIGFDIIATLADGEEFEMPVRSGHASGFQYIARWRHIDKKDDGQ